VLGADGLATGETVPGILVDCSTISADVSMQIRGQLAARGTELIDLPAALAAGLKMSAGWTAFSAGLATALTKGAALGEAVQFAVIAGGLAVTKEGVIPSLPRLGEVIAYARKLGLPLETLDGIS